MARKDRMDATGAVAMVCFSSVLALNQVVIKLTNGGLSPVFGAALRSGLALVVLGVWCLVLGKRITGLRQSLGAGLLLGTVFAVEFIFLFLALDLTTVSRSAILFYSMPIWLALAAHVWLPGEKLSLPRGIGLALAMAGVIWALSDQHSRQSGDLRGDIMAILAALCWAGIALIVRLTAVSRQSAETQLFWQLSVSFVILGGVAWGLGSPLRDPQWVHWGGLAFQAVIVASLGFLFWLKIMAIYPASDVAAFSFLSPVLAVGFGWLLLGETLSLGLVGALVLVAIGITLINGKRG